MEGKLESQADYIREITRVIAKLPVEKAAAVYDFARFLLSPPPRVETPIAEEDDWLNDSPEEIAQEDREWEATIARNSEQNERMAADAIAEYKAGNTSPLFGPDGELENSLVLDWAA